ncbi:MAG: sugar phosphate isomerase/epimerase [Propionibacteriaceae bacterium]|nr:sugar phosphate isomerase/epimerase [Propionibacteriaceae bacterium]
MQIGFVSALLDGWSFEEVIDVAHAQGFSCVEVACWPVGAADRRYAGVTHIDVTSLDDTRIADIKARCHEQGVAISSLGFYPNTMTADNDARQAVITHLHQVIDASAALDVNLVTTFIGRDQNRNVDENLAMVPQIWQPIMAHAESVGVRVAIENCPMLFGADQWPGGQNLFTTPTLWRRIFELVGSNNLGLNFDPSHFVWQMMDYIRPIYEFKDRLFHVHFKDIHLDRYRLDQVGTMAYPLDFMSPKLPGHGDIDWGAFISALDDVGYDGPACIEVEDRAYETSRQRMIDSLALSKRYIDNFLG